MNKIDLHHGDCLISMKEMNDNEFDLAIVDPPYGLGKKVVNSGGRFKRYENGCVNWDMDVPSDEYFNELFRVSKNQIIWGGNYFNLPPHRCFIVWDKQQPIGISFAMAELAWTSFDTVSQIFKMNSRNQKNRFHPTQKPVKLYEWILDNYAKQGDKILDTHLGSGSIAIACHNRKFDLTAYEIDKDYFEAASKRLKQHQQQLTMF